MGVTSWIYKKIVDVCDVIMGQSPPGHSYNKEGKGIVFFQGKLDFGNFHPNPSTWCTLPKKIAEPNDILISVRAPVGPTNFSNIQCCIGRGLAAIRPSNYINPLFVFYYIRSTEQEISKMGTGSTFSAISKSQIENLKIPLPPLPEQHRIVAKIDELFTRLDAGVQALKKIKAQLKRYRQAVLKYAFEGKLTEEWRKRNKDCHAELVPGVKEMLNQVQHDTFRCGPDIEDLPELPEGWVWMRVGEIGEIVTGTTPSKAKKEYYGKNYLFFKPTDLNSGYYVRESRDGLSKKGIKKARLLPAKSILVTCIGATIGKTGFIRTEGASNQQINAIIPKKHILPEFVYFMCVSPQFQKGIIDNASSTTLPILNKSKFEILLIPMATLPEQHKVVEEIERHFSVADEVEKVVEESLKQAERLRQSILKKAFEGKLVPQDPTDEPADKLLERIKAERTLLEKNKKNRIRQRNLKDIEYDKP
jgi:type I restriction enzyme S subunit